MFRTRKSGGFSQAAPCIQKVYNPDGSFNSTYKWNNGGLVGEESTIKDVVTPGYRRRRAHGELINNPVSLVRVTSAHTSNGHIQVGRHSDMWGTVIIEGDIGLAVEQALGEASSLPSDTGRHESIAITKAYSEMNSSPILAGEILNDLSQTISMLRHPFQGCTRLLNQIVKKRNWLLGKKAYTFTKANANAWLEYRYGWRPLIADGREAIRVAQKARLKADKVIRVARGGSKGDRSITSSITASIFSGNYTAKGTMVRTEKVRSNAGVFYQLSPFAGDYERSQALGLNARSFPATLWETIPYSFVVDWFVNVGDWLQAIMPRPDICVLGGWITSNVESTLKLSGGPLTRTLVNPTKTYTGSWNPVFNKTESYTRRANPAVPLTPVMRNDLLSSNQTVDAVALSVGKINQLLKAVRH